MDSTLSIYYNSYILDIEVIQMEQNEKRHPKTCFFIGHRNAPESLRTRLNATIEQLITRCGVTEFVVGHYGRFDAMCAGAVRDAKKRHQEISLVLLLPYYSPKGSKDFFTYYDETFYPPRLEQVPKRLAIVRANEYMINLLKSNAVIRGWLTVSLRDTIVQEQCGQPIAPLIVAWA